MSVIMTGAEVAKAMKERLLQETEDLKSQRIFPSLTILRVGNRPDDLVYERGARKRMELTGIGCKVVELPETVSQEAFEEAFRRENEDAAVHGILLMRPLPAHLDEEPIKAKIKPYKDVDCLSPVNESKIFRGDGTGFAPCTAQAVLEMLDHYGIELEGKRVTVVGRSMVVGRPLALMLLNRNATVTVCHTRTRDLKETCRNAQVLIAAAGKARMVGAEMVGADAVVVDVGINVDADGNLCGDVDFEAVEEKAAYLSPVPRGVGSVTTSVLASHVVRGARYQNGLEG